MHLTTCQLLRAYSNILNYNKTPKFKCIYMCMCMYVCTYAQMCCTNAQGDRRLSGAHINSPLLSPNDKNPLNKVINTKRSSFICHSLAIRRQTNTYLVEKQEK